MKILVEDEIQEAISRCEPSKIAVAYIGADWNKFIPDTDHLNTIIVSPTFGSNPRAILDVAKNIGWEKIHFLDELHAKTYIGDTSAVIGSANLTSNGLSGEGLLELCVEVSAAATLRKLNTTFMTLKQRAQEQYPTTESKKNRIRELEVVWDTAIANRIVANKNYSTPAFVDFELLGEEHFYVLWYQPGGEFEYSSDVRSVYSLIDSTIHFANTDRVERNKWALLWRITKANAPHKSAIPYWLYIHEVFDNGVVNDDVYPKCAIQRNDLEIPSAPFEITGEVAAAFRDSIQRQDIAEHLVQANNSVFSLADSLKGIPSLISAMREYTTKKQN